MSVRLPDNTKRTTILGSTGSGKTRAGVWLLSTRDFNKRPWVIIDFKCDDFIADIPGLKEISITDKPPKKPGLYVARPHPDDQEAVDKFLELCWAQEDVGLFFDEGLMIGKNGRSRWMRALLTQGRSKHIPMIILSQKPVWIDTWVMSESDYLWTFRLNRPSDRDVVQEYMTTLMNKRLPPFYSYWYDVGSDRLSVFSPVPDDKSILSVFRKRLKTTKKVRVT